MRKLIFSLLSILFVTGCSLFTEDAKLVVENYLGNYNTLDEVVMNELDNSLESMDLTKNQKDTYRGIIENQYQDIYYDITNISYDGDTAVVELNIEVYDLYSAQKNAQEYLNSNYEEFLNDNGEYNEEMFLDYKLDLMEEQDKRIEYSLEFELDKTDDGNWYVMQLDEIELEKIHGVYNYEI